MFSKHEMFANYPELFSLYEDVQKISHITALASGNNVQDSIQLNKNMSWLYSHKETRTATPRPRTNKLGRSWAKLSSKLNFNWNLIDLRFVELSWLINNNITGYLSATKLKKMNLDIPWPITWIPACLLVWLLVYMLSYISTYIGNQIVLLKWPMSISPNQTLAMHLNSTNHTWTILLDLSMAIQEK